jgi:ABC-type sugar transport system ATPase subunit
MLQFQHWAADSAFNSCQCAIYHPFICIPAAVQILYKVSGEMRPGEMLALMGPSGSGKTSLLSIISGRAPRAVTTSGKITSNGEKFTKAAKRRVGFVLQDDLLYEVSERLVCAGASSLQAMQVNSHLAVLHHFLQLLHLSCGLPASGPGGCSCVSEVSEALCLDWGACCSCWP